MKCSCSWTPLLALAGLAALGLGGYNMMKTGCPLGTCCEATVATVTPATHTTSVAGECAGKAECAGKIECAGKTECDTTAADCSKCPYAGADIVKTAAVDGAPAAECAGKTECTKADGVAKAGCESQCPLSKVADKGTPPTPPQNN